MEDVPDASKDSLSYKMYVPMRHPTAYSIVNRIMASVLNARPATI